MNHSDVLQGFGMLTAITEPKLNQELTKAFQSGVVPTQIHESSGGTVLNPQGSITLNANLAAPTIMILDGSENKQQVALNLHIATGTIKTHGSERVLNIKDWTYSFMVPMNVTTCTPEELQTRNDVPDSIKVQVGTFPQKKIKVSLIHLDFSSSKIDPSIYLKTSSSCPIPEDLGGGSLFDKNWNGILVDFQSCIINHFTSQEAGNKSYILGYVITVVDPKRDYISLPLFNPTACSFGTSFNEADQNLNTLNFLIVTNGDPLPKTLNAGMFTPWIHKEGPDGRLVVARELLFDRWVLPKIIKGLAWTLTEGDTSKISHVNNDEGWEVSYNTNSNWEENSIHYTQTQTHSIQVKIVSSQLNNAVVSLYGTYENKLDLSDSALAKASIDAKQDWSITVRFSVNEKGVIQSGLTRNIPVPTINKDQNLASKILNFLLDGTLKAQMQQIVQDWASHEHELATCLQSELSESFAQRLLLPSGEPIICTGIQFDEAANLLVDIKLK